MSLYFLFSIFFFVFEILNEFFWKCREVLSIIILITRNLFIFLKKEYIFYNNYFN